MYLNGSALSPEVPVTIDQGGQCRLTVILSSEVAHPASPCEPLRLRLVLQDLKVLSGPLWTDPTLATRFP